MATDFGKIGFKVDTPSSSGSKDFGSVSKPTFDQSQAALAHSQMAIDGLRQKEVAAQQQAQVANAPSTVAKETVKGTVGGLFNPLVKAARSGVQAIGEAFGAKAPNEQYTDLSGNPAQTHQADVAQGKESVAGAFGNMALEAATALPIGKGLKVGAEVAAPVIKEGAGLLERATAPVVKPVADYLAKRAEKKALTTSVEALTPKLTPTETKAAASSGKGTTSFFGGSKIDMTKDKNFMQIAENAKGIVKGKNVIEDINSVKNAISSEAENLKTQIATVDHPYTFRELSSKLSSAEEPISLKGTPFEKQIVPVKEAAIEIAKKHGGNISGLLDARKEFDALVEKTYPNLWDKENAPMRNAISSVRNAMNDFIEANLPVGTGFKESLKKQRMFYDAIDNLATKVPSEINKGGILQKTKSLLKNPVVQTLGGITGYNALKDKTPLGGVLP